MRRPEDPLVRRRRELLSRWPRRLAEATESHARWLAGDRAEARSAPEEQERDWLLLPRWIAEALLPGTAGENRRRELLDDVLWAQYCLYLAVRVEDDLFDGQAEDRSLTAAPPLLRSEAQRVLGRHLSRDSPFWEILHRYQDQTTHAILEVDELQRRPGALGADALEAYARVSRILGAGSAAICAAADRLDLLPVIEAFSDSVAIVDQILDDLADMEEDLENGRWNFAVNAIVSPLESDTAEGQALAARIDRNIVYDDAIGKLLAHCHEHLERARIAAAKLPVPGTSDHLDRVAERIDAAKQDAHERRVALFFARHEAEPP